jgi:hypothetical protein
MKANANLVLTGERVVLVPYRREHVETYHNWMVRPREGSTRAERSNSGKGGG